MLSDFFRRSIFVVCFFSILVADIIGDYKICIIRISFSLDSLPSTTGNGKFLQESYGIDCGDYTIDPTPHDYSYFRSQLKAVDSYFRSVSYGYFGIDLDNSLIYPDSIQDSYNLERMMSYYNPYSQIDLKDERLTELYRDALNLAYEKDSIDFSDFDQIVVFHAGIGQDFSLPFLDPTPEDIPSTFIDNKMIISHLGTNAITLGNSSITEGIILPETQNHLLYDISNEIFSETSYPCEYQYALTGTFALMLGFSIGLPPLWNIETGESGVGVFGLMDQGSNNGRGLIPAPPSAWSRYFAGWEQPFQVDLISDVTILSRREGQIVEIPIHLTESFLIENRTNYIQNNISLDSIRYKIWKESEEERYPSLVEVIFDSVNIQKDGNGVVTYIPDYDLGLPASGLLIWHIDNSIISRGLENFSVNSNIDNLGIDLEEADGAQDIGRPSFFFFNDPSSGYFGDMWFKGNKEYLRSNPSLGENNIEFGVFTFPNTASNNNADSWINIKDISGPGDTMSFTINNSMVLLNDQDTTIYIRSIFDVDGDGEEELIGGKDSIWISKVDELNNRKNFLPIGNSDISIGFEVDENQTLLHILEYGISFTKLWNFKYLFNSDTLIFSSSEILDSTMYTIHFSQNEKPELYSKNNWLKHIQNVFSQGKYHYSKSISNKGVSVTNYNGTKTRWTNSYFQYLAGVDLDLDANLDLLALEEDGNLYAFNSELNLMPGFPLGINLIQPVLARNIIGDDYPEIIGKAADSNILYILDHQGNIIRKIASNKKDQLIAIGTIHDQNVILTRYAIYSLAKSSNSNGNEWLFEHGNWGRNRTVSLNYSYSVKNNKFQNKSYCYPNPIRNKVATLRVESFNADNIKIIVYDMAGYFVDEYQNVNPGNGIQISEWDLDVSNLESGVYFARVLISKKDDAKINIIKLAVIN